MRCSPYEGNPRINDNAVNAVSASIIEFGFKVPIIVDRSNVIVAGHTRLKAAERLGLETVPVICADDLNEEQIKAFRLADNKTNELAEWDFAQLEKELAEIENIEMTDFGFDETDFEETDLEEISEDEIPEPPEVPNAQLGDIYKLGRHRLMCGDSVLLSDVRELMNGVEADLVVTDPPYNMNYQGAAKSKNREEKKILNDKMSEADFQKFLYSIYSNYHEVMKYGGSIYTFYKELGTGVFITAMKESALTFKQKLIWVKNQIVLGGSKYQSMFEPILMGCKGNVQIWNGKRKQRSVIESLDFMTEDDLREVIKGLLHEYDTDVIREKRQTVNDLHPTMKPVRLISYLIKNSSNKDNVVLDLFGGSGTTLISCEHTERTAYIMELDPRYVDVIIKRWETLTGQQAELISQKNK